MSEKNGSNKILNIRVTKIVRRLDFGGYHPTLKGNAVQVWVNIPQKLFDDYADFQAQIGSVADEIIKIRKTEADELVSLSIQKTDKKISAKEFDKSVLKVKEIAEIGIEEQKAIIPTVNRLAYEWNAEVLSQHKDQDTHFTADEFAMLHDKLNEEDPALYEWITRNVQQYIMDHRSGAKKNLRRRR